MQQKRYHVSMTVSEGDSKLILTLLSAGATDLVVREITGSAPAKSKPKANKYPRGMVGHYEANGTEDWKAKWAEQYWPRFEAVLKESQDQAAGYLDKRFVQIVKKSGKKPSMVSPLWTIFVRQGRVDRIGRGVYKLAEKRNETPSV